ncbi:hypothetical protein [Streptomyces sp. NPDC057052]|uniref:hypothetical protein n=1 Tax=Streptomyces sp. NPDC057052 TaxID=3346010 RepID=UPI0036409152
MVEGQDPLPTVRPPRSPAQIRQSRPLGWLLQTAGTISMALGGMSAAVSFMSLRTWDAEQGPSVVIGLALTSILLAGGRWATRRGQRHRAQMLQTLINFPEGEHVVLFLRSFADDEGLARIQGRSMREGLWLAPNDTEEQQLARSVSPFGTMVALGWPGDMLPQAGAGRHYSSDLEWQEQVLAALDRATLVLLVCGPGRQLRWEVEQVVARNQPEQLVLIGVRDAAQYESFRLAMQDLFPKGLPPSAMDRKDLTDGADTYVREAVWFDADWTPHITPLGSPDPEVEVDFLFNHHAWVETAFPLAIRPVYTRAGLTPPGLPSGRVARPWAVKVAVPLMTLAWGAVLASTGRSPGDDGLTMLVILGLPLALALYRTWRGGQFAPAILKLFSWLFGLLFVAVPLTGPFTGDGFLVTGPLSLPIGAALITGVLLLSRQDVHEWKASHAYKA